MNVLSALSFFVVAQELIISPLPSNGNVMQPRQSFATIVEHSNVLGATATSSSQIAPTPSPTTIPKKRPLTIAFLGDSMIDTLGPEFPAFKELLQQTHSHIIPTILNYGVGASNIEYGITRIANDYDYLGKHIPSLASRHPDIVIVESFAYNPFPDTDDGINRHWLALSHVVDGIKATLPSTKILIAATIAPNIETFGDNAPGIAFSPEEKLRRTTEIKKYLESTINFAKGEQIPLIDAYTDSLKTDGTGTLEYINPGDHIHPSDAGKNFFAEKVMETLENQHLLD